LSTWHEIEGLVWNIAVIARTVVVNVLSKARKTEENKS